MFDTNVVLDLLLARAPFVAEAEELITLVERGNISGVLGATTITTVFYLTEKALDREQARDHVGDLLALFDIAPVTRSVLQSALRLPFADFEDAVLHEAGKEAAIDGLVTRDLTGFVKSEVAVFSPRELLVVLDHAG